MEKVMIVSSDNHIGATGETYQEYLDPGFRADFDLILNGRSDVNVPKGLATVFSADEENRARFGNTPSIRLDVLERDGIVAEVLFPSPVAGGPDVPFTGFMGGKGAFPRDKQLAGQAAYNRWLADTLDKKRQIGLALIAFHDVEEAVRRIKWARKAGLGGILLDGVDPELPPLFDNVYDPLWSACVDEDLPVHWHVGAGKTTSSTATGLGAFSDKKRIACIHGLETWWFSRRALWHMIGGGVCERHPKLKLVFSELGCAWGPLAVKRMDHTWKHGGDGFTACRQAPSEYFNRQVHFGASLLSLADLESRHETGVDKIMWGTDHPHPTSAWGRTLPWARATFGVIQPPENELRAIMGENAVRLYGLDRDLLAKIAARVGPDAADLLRRDPEAENDPVIRNLSTAPTYV